jgi:aromatic ring hydroxylase
VIPVYTEYVKDAAAAISAKLGYQPVIRPSMNAVALTYELAHQPEYEDLMTATSHLSGKTINRFTHIHHSTDDVVKKSKVLQHPRPQVPQTLI